MDLSLTTAIGSDTSAADDEVAAVLRAPLVVNGEAILGAGAVARGVVIEATPAAKAAGRGRLAVRFDTIQLGPKPLPIQAAPVRWEAPGTTKRPPSDDKGSFFHRVVRKTKKGLRIGDDTADGSGGSGKAEVRFLPGAQVRIRLEQPAHIAP